MRATLLASLLLVLATPAFADQPVNPATPAPTGAILCSVSGPDVFGSDTAGLQSVCTATCDDGTTRTCSGSSCNAYDSACPSTTGRCWSDVEGYKYCPAPNCPNPCPGLTCSEMEGAFCKTGGTCYEPWLDCRAFNCNCYQNRFICP